MWALILQAITPCAKKRSGHARLELARRRFKEDLESVDKLARDLERLLEKFSPDLPTAVKSTELRFHLINALPEKILFQLKLLPKGNYRETISKAKELILLYHRTDKTEQTNQLVSSPDIDHLDRLEGAPQQMSEQMNTLGTSPSGPA